MLVTTNEEERVGLEEQKGERRSSDVSIVDRSERELRVTRANGIRDKRGNFDCDIRTRRGPLYTFELVPTSHEWRSRKL